MIHCIAVDFGEAETAPTDCKEKCFLMRSAYLHYSKAPQIVLMLMNHLRGHLHELYMNRQFKLNLLDDDDTVARYES